MKALLLFLLLAACAYYNPNYERRKDAENRAWRAEMKRCPPKSYYWFGTPGHWARPMVPNPDGGCPMEKP